LIATGSNRRNGQEFPPRPSNHLSPVRKNSARRAKRLQIPSFEWWKIARRSVVRTAESGSPNRNYCSLSATPHEEYVEALQDVCDHAGARS
jgi:hypothetical protein